VHVAGMEEEKTAWRTLCGILKEITTWKSSQ